MDTTPIEFVDDPDNGLFKIKKCTCGACDNLRRARSEKIEDSFARILLASYGQQYTTALIYTSRKNETDRTFKLLAESEAR